MNVAPLLLLWALVCLTIFQGQAYRWTSHFKEGQLVYSCVGKTVTFPWEFQLETGEELRFIRWTFDGYFSSDTLATFSEDFLPASAYTKRIKQVGVAGIELDQTKMEDSGNYSVEISGVNSAGVFFTLSGMAALQVGDRLLAEDQEVKVTQLPAAIKVNSTGRWSVALACGKFEHLGVPPFPVHWTIPSGEVITESSRFQDGHYILLLANPVRGGNYTCQVPEVFADDACLTSDHNAKVKATITVDEIQARLTLLEAHQAELIEEKEELQTSLAQRTQELNFLKTAGDNSSERIVNLENLLKDLQVKVTDVATPRIAFNAWSTESRRYYFQDRFRFNKVLYNQGDGFDADNGVFTAPVTGTYFFVFRTEWDGSDHSTMVANGQDVCFASFRKVCQAVVHLVAGNKVLVRAPGEFRTRSQHQVTSFAGFLLSDDSL